MKSSSLMYGSNCSFIPSKSNFSRYLALAMGSRDSLIISVFLTSAWIDQPSKTFLPVGVANYDRAESKQ